MDLVILHLMARLKNLSDNEKLIVDQKISVVTVREIEIVAGALLIPILGK